MPVWPGGKRSFLGPSEAGIVSIGFAVVIGCTRGAIFVFVIARDAERAAQFFGQRRLAEQAGFFEAVEIGEIAQAGQPPQRQEGRRRHRGARRDGAIIHAVLHWQGGDHTELQVKQRLNAAGRHNPRVPDDTIALMRELARLMPDCQIARLLNRIGIVTGHGNAWTQARVRGFRNHHEIAGHRDGEWAERGEITLEAAAKIVGVCNMTALRMLRRGDIKGRQVCPGAPWVIKTADLTGFTGRKRSDPPLTPNPDQRAFDFQ